MPSDQSAAERFRMLVAAEARLVRAEEACRLLGLIDEAQKLADMRATVVAELEPLRRKE